MVSPFLSVVIPTYNGLHYLRDCVPALLAAIDHAKIDSEVVVVDDCSADQTVKWLEKEHPRIKMVLQPCNTGFAVAANAGIGAASGKWVALVNNDVIVDRQWISAALADDIPDDVGSIATQILFLDRKDIINSAGDEYASCGFALPRDAGRPAAESNPPMTCFCACAAAAFYRRSAVKKVGLLRESLGAYYDDVDLGFRLNLAGYRCLYVARSRCWHVAAGTYGQNSWTALYNSARNRDVVFWGNMPGRLLMKYAPAHVLIVLLQLCWSVFGGGFLPKLGGTFAAVFRIPEILRIRHQARELRTVYHDELDSRLLRQGLGNLMIERLKPLSRRRK